MKKITLIILLISVVSIVWGAKPLAIVDKGKSSHTIFLQQNSDSIAMIAANKLQHYVELISGAKLPIEKSNAKKLKKIIVLDQSDKLADDEFKINIEGNNLIIKGGKGYGVLYGVQEILENQWGVRKYTDKVEVVPANKTLTLPYDYACNQNPKIIGRNLFYNNVKTKELMDWLRLTQKPNSSVNRGRWGLWVHTFARLVPASKYFDKYPQYYTLDADGKRSPSQLCLSNNEVIDVICDELGKLMEKNPEAIYWSVSQNDNQNYCRCPQCRQSYEKEGSPSGITVEFVNKIAARFPEKNISTLAYQYTRKAPKYAKPLPNVNIMLCNIECGRETPIEQSEKSASFCRDMEDWGKLTNNIILWDYVVQFSNLYTPFPNFHTLGPNLKYFVQNNVTSMFSQGSPEPATEMTHLRAYVSGKLLWNPNANVDSLVNDFIYGYYGDAAPYIREYFDALHNAIKESGERLDIFGDAIEPRKGYLSPKNVENFQAIFNKAENAVQNNHEILSRVQFERAPLYFVELEQSHVDPFSEKGYLIKKENNVETNPEFYDRLNLFVKILNDNGARKLCEWATPIDTYKNEMEYIPAQWIEMIDSKNIAKGKQVEFLCNIGKNRPDVAKTMLTDAFLGSRSFSENWLSIARDTVKFNVDLGQKIQLEKVKIRFAQSILDNAMIPYGYKVYTSDDGVEYTLSGSVSVPIDRKTNYKFSILEAQSKTTARFVQIVVDVVGDLPMWHRDAGRPCKTLIDEIAIF